MAASVRSAKVCAATSVIVFALWSGIVRIRLICATLSRTAPKASRRRKFVCHLLSPKYLSKISVHSGRGLRYVIARYVFNPLSFDWEFLFIGIWLFFAHFVNSLPHIAKSTLTSYASFYSSPLLSFNLLFRIIESYASLFL